MRVLLVPTLLLLALLPARAALADGCPAPCSGQSSSPPGTKYLYVQSEGPRGAVTAYDTATRQRAFSLPPGASSANGRWHVATGGGVARTRLWRFDLRTGRVVTATFVPGRWRVAALSPTGAWAALVSLGRSSTRLAVVDAARGTVIRRTALRGRFEVETLSADGSRMFLIEHLNDASYLVRLYDVRRNRLVTQALKASGEGAPMVGYAWSGLASPDGRWLLTLYLNTHHRHAFVHALDVGRAEPYCIGLPSGRGALRDLERYTLTLSPDGRRLYAANPALGRVSVIELAAKRVVREVRFAPSPAGASTRNLLAGTISRNGRTLYFSAGRDLWAYDAAFGRVRGPYPTGGRVVGFGYGAGDRTVHALRTDGRIVAFEAATGRRLG